MPDPARAGPPAAHASDAGAVRRVAVVGAGIAGLACTRALVDRGATVVVYEKSRGVGGRAATRRVPAAEGGGDARQFDHGAQYFTARDPAFAALVAQLVRAGHAARWEGRVRVLDRGEVRPAGDGGAPPERWVGVPGMSAVGRALSAGLDVRLDGAVAAVVREGGGWLLHDAAGRALGRHDAVVVAVPAPQAAPLLRAAAPALAARAAAAPMTPCWSAMVAFRARLELPLDGAFVGARGDGAGSAGGSAVPGGGGSPLAWVARDGAKPGREVAAGADTWVLHAGPAWSAANLERAPADVAPELLAAFREAAGVALPPHAFLAARRWRYATPDPSLAEPFLLDADLGVGACGDWCGGPRVEGAYLSGRALAASLAGRLPEPPRVGAVGR
jgi:predicted NAD/FAD-dependent oxidoreductase